MSAAAPVHLRMYGALEWSFDGSTSAIPDGKTAAIVVHLAARHGSVVPTSTLIDLLWTDAPNSGANAVQRHIHRVRSQVGELGSSDPNSVIETVGSGYRLSRSATTDRQALEEYLSAAPSNGSTDEVRWWARPLGGAAPIDQSLTAALGNLAVQVAAKWVPDAIATGRGEEALERLGHLVEHHGHDDQVWELLLDAADASGDRAAVGRATERASQHMALQPSTPSGLSRRVSNAERARVARRGVGPRAEEQELLNRVGSLWLAGDEGAALDLVDQAEDQLDPDLRRRIVRWMVWVPREDAFGRTCWRNWSVENAMAPEHAERSIVSLDARAIEFMPDAIVAADADVELAADEAALTRSLRVRFMVGLGWPLSTAQYETVEMLESLRNPDARVEASRFRAILSTKAGRFGEGIRQLDEYRERIRDLWPQSGDDFDELMLAALSRHPEAESLGIDSLGSSTYPTFAADPAAHDVSSAWAVLLGQEDVLGRSAEDWLSWLRHTGGSACSAAAYELVCRSTEECIAPDTEPLATLLEIIQGPRRDRSYQAALWALATSAIRWNDRDLATIARTQLDPWAQEELGIWPMDALLGSASSVIDRLDGLQD